MLYYVHIFTHFTFNSFGIGYNGNPRMIPSHGADGADGE